MIDFFMANFLTESGGLVEVLTYAATDGSLYFKFELIGAACFTELSLSELLTVVTVEN